MRRTTTGPAVRRRRTVAGRVPTVLVTLVCGGAAVACGGTSSASTDFKPASKDAAQQICAKARGAAAAALHRGVSLKIADRDPTNVECRLRGAGTRLDLVAQQAPQAWTMWDTTQVHQLQAYGPRAHPQKGQIPLYYNAPGVLVGWIPAQRMIFATNGTQSKGGSYVTVTVSGKRHGRDQVRLARAVTLAALEVAPKGPNLAPPS